MNQKSLHILIADDDYPYSVLLRKTLIGRGHSVVVVNSGDGAIDILAKEHFDIVLLDYKMEGTNGINVLQWIYGKKIDVPVILITAYGSEQVYEETFKWGAMEYFVKGEMDTVRLPILVEQVYNRYLSRHKKKT